MIIQSDDISQCIWCYSQAPTWHVDSLPIAPGASVKIALGGFVEECSQSYPGEICLSTVAPNHKADGNYLNDNYCATYSVLVPIQEIQDKNEFRLGPNPAQDYVNVITDFTDGYEIQFIDMYGRQLINKWIKSSFEEINI